ncbi:hypothetical protein AB0E08_08325 [Streptomyces sp. NPDC048281]|uniref:hypothetical protein n=1 Tax=Streptomyces sp. NPDC048281 TaxID=3154715 RepID=UPI003439C1EB
MPQCPEEKKRKFTSREQAMLAAGESGRPDLNSYLCVCGWWHLTKKNSVGRASEQLVQTLRAASEKEFASLVLAELEGKATPDEAAALRSDDLLWRWKQALSTLLVESQQQLNATLDRDDSFTREWRKRRQRWVQQAAARRKEMSLLLRSLQIRRAEERRAGKDARVTPRNRAIDRLINAHQDEFDRLLKEEEGAE